MALEKEYQIFEDNLDEWLETHRDQFVLIHDASVEFFDDQETALETAISQYEPGSFLLQQVVSKDEDTLIYFSRLAII